MRQLYTQYSENYDNAMVTYEKAKKNRAFAQFLEKTQKDTNEQKDLLTYLFLPVQRMLAYDSLLKVRHNTLLFLLSFVHFRLQPPLFPHFDTFPLLPHCMLDFH